MLTGSRFYLPYSGFRGFMRARVMRLTLHFLAGIVLGAFLLPEGASMVIALAAAAAGAKAFYDHLKSGADLLAAACIVAGSVAVLLLTV